jgi:hypothetical protein
MNVVLPWSSLLLCQRTVQTTHNHAGLLAGLKSLCIWGADSLTAMGCLHLTALTALTLLRAEGCNTVFGAGGTDDEEDEDCLHLSSQVSQCAFNLAVGSPRIGWTVCVCAEGCSANRRAARCGWILPAFEQRGDR